MRQPLGVVGGIILLVVFGSALLADYLAPHEPNKQRLVALARSGERRSATYLLNRITSEGHFQSHYSWQSQH